MIVCALGEGVTRIFDSVGKKFFRVERWLLFVGSSQHPVLHSS